MVSTIRPLGWSITANPLSEWGVPASLIVRLESWHVLSRRKEWNQRENTTGNRGVTLNSVFRAGHNGILICPMFLVVPRGGQKDYLRTFLAVHCATTCAQFPKFEIFAQFPLKKQLRMRVIIAPMCNNVPYPLCLQPQRPIWPILRTQVFMIMIGMKDHYGFDPIMSHSPHSRGREEDEGRKQKKALRRNRNEAGIFSIGIRLALLLDLINNMFQNNCNLGLCSI